MRRALLLALVSGCSSILGIDDFKLGDAGTTGGEVPTDAEQGYCLGPTGFRVCLMAAPTGAPVDITTSLTIDTVGSPLCAPVQPMSWKAANQPDACFIIAPSVTFNAPMITATGSRPLVVFASDTISITTQLDVASHRSVTGAPRVGPAAPSGACVAPTAAGSSVNGAGGGAGGSFMTKGGDGGPGTGAVQPGRAANANTSPPTTLRGGCSGGVGGQANQPGGAPGTGGGAVYLVAGGRIVINGFINASGAGADGGGIVAGGGGGGSGGMVVLHAPMISSTTGNGLVTANGGGGGGGGGNNAPGQSGIDPSPTQPFNAAVGGVGGNTGGGNGGNGFSGTLQATIGSNGNGLQAGGGGGGGAAGYIRSNVALTAIMASPSATVVP